MTQEPDFTEEELKLLTDSDQLSVKPTRKQVAKALTAFLLSGFVSVVIGIVFATALFWLCVDVIAQIDISIREAIGGGLLLGIMARNNNK